MHKLFLSQVLHPFSNLQSKADEVLHSRVLKQGLQFYLTSGPKIRSVWMLLSHPLLAAYKVAQVPMFHVWQDH